MRCCLSCWRWFTPGSSSYWPTSESGEAMTSPQSQRPLQIRPDAGATRLSTFTRFAGAAIICGVDLISDALPFRCLWYGEPNAASNAIDYAKFYSRSHDAVIRVYDEAGNIIKTHEQPGDFRILFYSSTYRTCTRYSPSSGDTLGS